MTAVWVVLREVGDHTSLYDDYECKPVAARRTRDDAIAHALLLKMTNADGRYRVAGPLELPDG